MIRAVHCRVDLHRGGFLGIQLVPLTTTKFETMSNSIDTGKSASGPLYFMVLFSEENATNCSPWRVVNMLPKKDRFEQLDRQSLLVLARGLPLLRKNDIPKRSLEV